MDRIRSELPGRGREGAVSARNRSLPRWLPRAELAAVFAAWLGMAAALQWANGAYRYPLLDYPDESAHYVTGIMVHDFLLRPTAHPLEFARQFYRHYPRISILHWPPMLYAVEGAWMAPFGTSPASALALMAALAAAIALLLYREAARRSGRVYGAMAGALFLSLGITQWQAGMVMMEMLLALLTLAACLELAAYLRSGRLRDSLLFGALAAAAILTRGDGWALAPVPALAALLLRAPGRLRERRLWASALVAAPVCACYTVLTYPLASLGWPQQSYSLAFVRDALPKSGTDLLNCFGIAGLALLALGIARHLSRRGKEDPLWIVLISMIASVFVLENIVPAGIEPRKLFVLIPPATFLIVDSARILGCRVSKRRPVTAALGILLAAGAASGFRIFEAPPRDHSSLGEAAAKIASRPDLDGAAVLVSAGWREGVFVGELAALDRRPAHYVLRATKQLMLECDDIGQRCPARFSTAEPVLKFLDSVPVAAIVFEPDRPIRAEEASLLAALNSAPDVWHAERLPGSDGAPPAWLYTRLDPLPRRQPHFRSGLESKLGRIGW